MLKTTLLSASTVTPSG